MISQKDGQLFVSGSMNHQSAAALLIEGLPSVSVADSIINLSAVNIVDSSALAVVLGWKRAAQAGGHALQIAQAPEAFISLASLYGVDTLLFPIESGTSNSAHH
jgi:phospholipid transport system transporter-binding protein